MKNETQNLINVLLVVAIVLAIGGTWLNLNKLNEVKKVTLSGYAVAGGTDKIDEGITQIFDASTNIAADQTSPATSDAGDVTSESDCYLSSDNTQLSSLHTTACIFTGSMPPVEITIRSNNNTDLDWYYLKNITAMFGAYIARNHQYVGKVNCTPNLNGGTYLNSADTTYIRADYNDSITKLVNLAQDLNSNSPSEINCTIQFGFEIDALTPPGPVNNTGYAVTTI